MNKITIEQRKAQSLEDRFIPASYRTIGAANLSGANLSGANLKGATGITIEELEKVAKSLEGATMPDGTIHP